MKQPFSTALRHFLVTASCLALGIGLFAHSDDEYSKWLSGLGIPMPGAESLHLGGADVMAFYGSRIICDCTARKRGIEIQAENDLTI